MHVHNVFHPNLLRPVAKNPLPGQHNPPPPPVVVNEGKEEEWEVDDIIDAKVGRGKKLYYRVKWKEYDEDRQWYSAANFDHAKEIVNAFYKHHPAKPR